MNHLYPICRFFLLTLLCAPYALANPAPNTPPDASLDTPQTTLDLQKRRAEEALTRSGRSIDRFITQRILRKKDEHFSNSSADARITLETGYFKHGTLKSDLDFDVSLALPTTKKHLRLFAGGEKSYFDDKKTNNAEQRLEKTDLQAGLQYTFHAIKRWNPRLRSGVKYRRNQLDPFAEFKLSRRFGSDAHYIDLSQSERYSRLERMVHTTHINTFNALSPHWNFRFANSASYQRPTRTWTYQHSPIFTHVFSTQGRWINQLTLSGQSDADKAYTQANLSTRVIHPVYRPWILLEIEPVHTRNLIDNSTSNALYLRVHFLLNR